MTLDRTHSLMSFSFFCF